MANRVKAALGITLNIGNFQSARIDCGIEADVQPGETTGEAMERVYDSVEAFVNTKVKEMQKDITED